MNITTDSICYDLLVIPLKDGVIDISWSINTDELKSLLEAQGIEKIINFQDRIDFDIEINNVDTFDSINLKQYKYSEIEQQALLDESVKTYRGNIVFSAIIPFNKDKFEETNYFIRVKLNNAEIPYNINSNPQIEQSISFNDAWSDIKEFVIPKNYTKDLVEIMYRTVADFNAYNKEAKSANMYYIFQAVATQLNEQFKYAQNEKNRNFIEKSLPDLLKDTFGVLFKFDDVYGLTMEEYRRILQKLIVAYQYGGAWNYIKEVVKYLIGYTPELVTLKNFYPWVLRTKKTLGITQDSMDKDNPIVYGLNDPTNFLDRNYYNPESNYYIFNREKIYDNENNYYKNKNLDKNLVMLFNNNEKLFSFIIKIDNFFNRDIDKEKIITILNLLKSVYTKYILNIEVQKEKTDFNNFIYINDEEDSLLVSDYEHFLY